MSVEGSSEPTPVIRNCISCGRAIDYRANVCPYCGYDYRVPIPSFSGPLPARRSGSPTAGGILVLIAGILAFVNAASLLSFSVADFESAGVSLPEGVTADEILGILRICGGVEILFGAIAILGGVFAIQRKHFGLALTGAILSMLAIGLLIGALLGLIGLILIVVARREFS